MVHERAAEASSALRDGRTISIRLSRLAEAAAIAQAHPLPRMGNLPEALCRNYYQFKALQYIRAPGGGIISGWVEGELAGFIFLTRDLSGLKRHLVSPGNLLWLTKEAVCGRFGYRPGFWLEALRWGLQHLRQPRDYREQPREELPAIESWIGTVHTVDAYRRLGVASALLAEAEECLQTQGCKQVALWAADDNEPALQLYEKLNYRRVTKVGRIREECWLMLKTLNDEDSNR